MNLIISSVLILVVIAGISSVILYVATQKFKVEEDPKVVAVEAILPEVNCGGCGYAGCKSFAQACVKSETLEGLYCPPGGKETMSEISHLLGIEFTEMHDTLAVVRCNGSCANRQHSNVYDGAKVCAIASMTYGGETACPYGCLGFGDCVTVCNFDAIYINKNTMLPEVDESKCTSCGVCVKACPKLIIEIRKKEPYNVYVSCVNKDKGGPAKKACNVACIGCGKCVKTCPYDAIIMSDNLAYIDDKKCELCGDCIPVCPTKAIKNSKFQISNSKLQTDVLHNLEI